MSGPLHGVKVIELAGLGPCPFAGMVLADFGADVIRVDRVEGGEGFPGGNRFDLHNRGKRSISVDLKHEAGVRLVLALVATADVLIEGFRPGVAERMGLGPDVCLARNPRLVFGRMTGWGQEGPLSSMAGHDIDYIAVSGVLGAVGTADRPVPPLNLVGDFGGGGMLLVVGVLAALLRAQSSGEGQVVDASMTDGSALLTTSHHGFMAEGWWGRERESNLLDGGAPYYTVYRTADDRHVAVGALEPRFFSSLLDHLDLDASNLPAQGDQERWPEMRETLAARFATRTRDEWAEHFAGSDACVAPVLDLSEAPAAAHNVARETFVSVDGVVQPAPAPRFTSTPARVRSGPVLPGADTDEILGALGLSHDEVGKLRASRTVA